MNATTLKFVLDEHNNLVPASKMDETKLELYKKTLEPGAKIEVFLSQISDDKSLAQLAKVHAMIREIANFTGHSFEEIKNEVKERSGLVLVYGTTHHEYKSFSNCSKDELSMAIQTCMEIGAGVGYYFS
jgi:uncharacterized protein YvpB